MTVEPTPVPANDTTDVGAASRAVLAAARRWGIEPQTPESEFVESLIGLSGAVASTAARLDERVAGIGGPEMAERLEIGMRRAAATGLANAARGIQQASRWRAVAAVAAAVALALCVGFFVGFQAGGSIAAAQINLDAAELQAAISTGTAGADFLATVAMNNDSSALAALCDQTSYAQAGGRACVIRLWTKGPPAAQ